MDSLLWYSLLCFFINLVIILYVNWGIRQLKDLREVAPLEKSPAPKVSIIIPACNEAKTIAPALDSVMSLSYPELEILVVNDRSTDNTGAVLSELEKKHPALQVLTIKNLPAGWLGKSHALHSAAMRAKGDFLLFTDADILFERSTLDRAMSYVLAHQLDHLSLLFKNVGSGGLLNTAIFEGMIGLLFLFKPWKVKIPASRHYMGIGAFNLIQTAAYKKIGGHQRIAMHPIDDIMLGKIIKQEGFSQDCLMGHEFIQVKWYGSIGEFINGVMKNLFALYRFNPALVALSIFFLLGLQAFPIFAMFFTDGIIQTSFIGAVAVRIIANGRGFIRIGLPCRYALWSLITPFLSTYISIRAVIATYRNNGITWRGTHYPLSELKKGIQI